MSTIDSTSTSQRDVYRKVTDAIINAIEQGVGTAHAVAYQRTLRFLAD
jgi:hypothetical protein